MKNKYYSLTLIVLSLLLLTSCGRKKTGQPYDIKSFNESLIFTDDESGVRLKGFSDELCVPYTESEINGEGVNAEAFGLFSVDGCEVISQKNAFERVYPASTTKIMTCLLALENGSLTEYVTVPKESEITVSGSSMADLKPGDRMTMEDMLHALMVPSGNDAAAAIAVHIGGSLENFAQMMNEKALSLGATNTHFANPHGLPDDDHYTTVYDMYLIFNEALKNPDFCRISQTSSYEAAFTNSYELTDRRAQWTSGNGFYNGKFTLPDGLTYTAGKTGHTNAAGYCLVLSEKDTAGNDYISIIMKAPSYDDLYGGMINLCSKASCENQ